ncbi:MAG: sulfatase-like hydrolase/transferase, partial [Bacteroidota bacterium]
MLTRIVALLAVAISAHARDLDRPNILLLFSDDQRADAIGAYGNPYVQTPNIDEIAKRGVRFTNAYCMGSHHGAVCAPSRAMLMSGRTLFHVYDRLEGVTTFPILLQGAGYITFGTGKWHNEKDAFKESFTRGKDVFFGGMSDHFRVPVQDLNPDGSYTEIETKGFSSTVFADAAIEFLSGYAKGARSSPFFVYVSFTAPHDPRTPPGEYLTMYHPEEMPLPPDYMPLHPFHNGWMTGRDEQLAPWPRPPEVIRSQLAEYYGMISHMDAEIGRILTCLRGNGLLENTLVVFASDHGLSLGSHGLMGKQNLYEHSMKAPLMFSGPGIPGGGERDALSYLFDIGPTILQMAGVDVPTEMEGKSLEGVISGDEWGVRSSLFTAYEIYQRAVRDRRWKLIRYPQLHYSQLFDLKHDPYELKNLAEDPRYQTKTGEMMNLLLEWQGQVDDLLPLTAAQMSSMEYD